MTHRRLLFYPMFLALLFAAPPVYPGTVIVPGASGGLFTVKVTSMKELKFRSTVKQQYDFSCGSAALATLLTYHYNDASTEEKIFNSMYESGDKKKIRANGFSLLDMKNYLERNGYSAGGYEASLDRLAKIGVPAIALITINGYKHFVVIKGVTKKEVLLGDPALGLRTISRAEFEPMWNKLLFLIRNKKDVAAAHFNTEREWGGKIDAPVTQAVRTNNFTDLTIFLR